MNISRQQMVNVVVHVIEPCSVRELPFEQVSSGDCVSINRIARQQCLGTCISGMLCRCCSPSKISMEEISMKCQRIENNSTITFIEQRSYAKIDSCSCQECLKYY
jgi:ABC-type transport system involved in Fe-S cluster assembly fused permease/ATPase subunit